jgi:hypothetical protein
LQVRIVLHGVMRNYQMLDNQYMQIE